MKAFVIKIAPHSHALRGVIVQYEGKPTDGGYFDAGCSIPPARWAADRDEAVTKWRAKLDSERVRLRARLAELDAMESAGPVFQYP